MLRSPPLPSVRREKVGETAGTPVATRTEMKSADATPLREATVIPSSPHEEYMLKMRKNEEETIEKCKAVLRAMRQAMGKQKSISIEVKNGVSELEELLDVTCHYRRNWIAAENKRRNSKTVSSGKGTPAVPETPRTKRMAKSPLEVRISKKSKVNDIEAKKPSERGMPRPISEKNRADGHVGPKIRSEAVIIQPREGHSFAEILKNMKSVVRPEETETNVQSIRKTKTGAILLELGKGGKKEQFCEAIKGALKDTAAVKDVKPKVTVEIRDLDLFSTKEEVVAALVTATESQMEDINVRITETNDREQRRAFASLPAICASKLLKDQRIKIGWTRCRVRYREDVKRCFRCFQAGHMQWECKGPNRKEDGICIRCGEKGHKMRDCKNPKKCCICLLAAKEKTDHIPGSKNCEANMLQAR